MSRSEKLKRIRDLNIGPMKKFRTGLQAQIDYAEVQEKASAREEELKAQAEVERQRKIRKMRRMKRRTGFLSSEPESGYSNTLG